MRSGSPARVLVLAVLGAASTALGVEFQFPPKFTHSDDDLLEVPAVTVLPDGRFNAPSIAGMRDIRGLVPASILTRRQGEDYNRFQVLFPAFLNAMEPAIRDQDDADDTELCTLIEGAVFDFSDLVFDVSTGRIFGTFTEEREFRGSLRFLNTGNYFDCLEPTIPEKEITFLEPGLSVFIGGNGLAPAAGSLRATAYDADNFRLNVYSNANPHEDDWKFDFAWSFEGFEIGNSIYNRPASSFTSWRSWDGDRIGGMFSTLFPDNKGRVSLYMWWHYPADGQSGVRKVDEVTAAEFPSEEVDFIFQDTDCLGMPGTLYCLHWNDRDQEWRVSWWHPASGPEVPVKQLAIPRDREWFSFSYLGLANHGRNLVPMSSGPEGGMIWNLDGVSLTDPRVVGAGPRTLNPYGDPLEIYDLGAFEEIQVETGSAPTEFRGAQGMMSNFVSSSTGEISVAWSGSVQQSNVTLDLPFEVNPGISGSWFDPEHDGEGFVIQVLSATSALVFWFTYTTNGEQAWFIGVGTIIGDTIVVEDMQIASGATFGPDFDSETVVRDPWGVLTLGFDDCNNGFAGYVARPNFGASLQRIKRLTRIVGLDCVEPAANTRTAAATGADLDGSYSGAWYDLSHDGEGFAIEIINATTAVIFWFTYTPDGDGKQAWMIGVGRVEGDTITVEAAQITSGGEFGPDFDPEKVMRSGWGKLTFTFTGCDTAELSYVSGVEGYGEGSLALTRLTALSESICGPEAARSKHRALLGHLSLIP